jgi:hypothetical protein
MTKRINIIGPRAVQGGPGVGWMTVDKNPWSVPDGLADELVNRRAAEYTDAQTKSPSVIVWDPSTQQAFASGEVVTLGGAPASISGSLGVGNTLTVVPKTGWRFATGQWYRDGAAIAGAVALTYQQVPTDGGRVLEFQPDGIQYRVTAGKVPSDASVPTVLFVKQSIRIVDQTPIARLLHRSSARNSVIVRNIGTTILQIGFTTNNNNNNNAPGAWTDVAVGEEFYEGDVDHQIWARAKTAGETVTAQIEVETPRV